MAVTGVDPTDVGPRYDIAIGWNNAGNTVMYGYVAAPSTQWQVSADIEDDTRLVQISSPNTTDRFTQYPMTSQGDWSGGSRQAVFTDATRFWDSSLVETSQPGLLSTVGTPQTIGTGVMGAPVGTYNAFPVATEGRQFYIGWQTATADLFFNGNAVSITAGNPEIIDMISTPSSVFAYTTSGTYLLSATTGLGTQWSNDVAATDLFQGLAYYGSKGQSIYYISAAGDQIIAIATAGGAKTVVFTKPTIEQNIRVICSTATGLFWATTSSSYTFYPCQSVLYTSDGATTSRIADFPGMVKAATEMNGTTYILGELYQGNMASSNHCYTLFSLVGSTLSVIDDLRFDDPTFQPNLTANQPQDICRGNMTTDGRFLYIAWPGLGTRRYDPIKGAFVNMGFDDGGNSNPSIWAHRVCPFNLGFGGSILYSVQAWSSSPILTAVKTFIPANPRIDATGWLQTSWFDFGAPNVVKAFRTVEVDLKSPVGGGLVTVQYRLDNTQAFSSAISPTTLSNGNLRFALPANTKGHEIQIQLNMTSAQIRQISVKANLARVWDVTLACRRGQQDREGSDSLSVQGTSSQGLLANLFSAYANGGYVTVYAPDETASSGVVTITAEIQKLTKTVQAPPGLTDSLGSQGWDMEGDVAIRLVEQL